VVESLSSDRRFFACLFEETMSLDKSLKKAGNLARARNVLSRAERLALLQEDERWVPANGVFNLPKTKYRRLAPGQSGPKRPEDLKKD
jgi:small basic protein (TIGR04137 family)